MHTLRRDGASSEGALKHLPATISTTCAPFTHHEHLIGFSVLGTLLENGSQVKTGLQVRI